MFYRIAVNGDRELRHRTRILRCQLILAKLQHGDGDGLIQALGIDIDAMQDAVRISEGYAAAGTGHATDYSACFAFYSPLLDSERRKRRYHGIVPNLKDIRTWKEHLGQSKLRSFTDAEGHFWLEQNRAKASKWAKLARKGHDIAWEFARPGGDYTGRMLVDGEIYTPSEATKKFLQGSAKKK